MEKKMNSWYFMDCLWIVYGFLWIVSWYFEALGSWISN
jgi:hypothetical protein